MEDGLQLQLQEAKSRLDGKADLSQLAALREELRAMVEQRVKGLEEALDRLRSQAHVNGRTREETEKPEDPGEPDDPDRKRNEREEPETKEPEDPGQPNDPEPHDPGSTRIETEELKDPEDPEEPDKAAGSTRKETEEPTDLENPEDPEDPKEPDKAPEEPDKDPRKYELQQSSWDTLLICGPLTHFSETCMVVLCSLLNIAIQLGCCFIIQTQLARPVLTTDTLKELAIWRMAIGHDVQHIDELTRTSLVERTCRNVGYAIKSEAQSTLYAQLDSYSPLLCVIALFFWVTVVLGDVASTLDFSRAIWSLPQCEETRVRGSALSCGTLPAGHIVLETISKRRLTVLMMAVVIPKLTVATLLGFWGVRYLVYLKSSADLLLKAIALSFILSTDERLFMHIVPVRVQRVLARAEPLAISDSLRPPKRFRHIPLRSIALTSEMFLLVLIFSRTWLATELDLHKRAMEILCGGDRDFVYVTDKSLRMVSVAGVTPIDSTRNLFSSNLFRSVLQKTGLEPADTLDELRLVLPSDFTLYQSDPLYKVRDMDLHSFQEAANQLPCRNMDGESRAHSEAFLQLSDGWNCSHFEPPEEGGQCRVALRPFCPITCGCHFARSSMYNRVGCSVQCDDMQSVSVDFVVARTQQGCTDVAWKHMLGTETYFGEVQLTLLELGRLREWGEHEPGFIWPGFASVASLSVRPDPAFLSVTPFNLTRMAQESQQSVNDDNAGTEPGACGLVTLVYQVFNVDLCFPDSRLGSIRALCTRTCGTCGDLQDWPHYQKSTTGSLIEWMSRTLTNQLLQPMNSTDDACSYYEQFPKIHAGMPPAGLARLCT